MGEIETNAASKRRRGQLKRAVLTSIKVAGVVSLAIAAPNALQLISRSVIKTLSSAASNSRSVTLARLIKEGLVVRERTPRGMVLRITESGKRYLNQRVLTMPRRPKKWDGRWRVVMFDIREKRRSVRDSLRRQMRAVGFYRLQDSVWIHPFPCDDFIALLKADLHVGKDVLYGIFEKLENDRFLRETFGLPIRTQRGY